MNYSQICVVRVRLTTFLYFWTQKYLRNALIKARHFKFVCRIVYGKYYTKDDKLPQR